MRGVTDGEYVILHEASLWHPGLCDEMDCGLDEHTLPIEMEQTADNLESQGRIAWAPCTGIEGEKHPRLTPQGQEALRVFEALLVAEGST